MKGIALIACKFKVVPPGISASRKVMQQVIARVKLDGTVNACHSKMMENLVSFFSNCKTYIFYMILFLMPITDKMEMAENMMEDYDDLDARNRGIEEDI